MNANIQYTLTTAKVFPTVISDTAVQLLTERIEVYPVILLKDKAAAASLYPQRYRTRTAFGLVKCLSLLEPKPITSKVAAQR